ncbi:MAG: CDP-archaeol synthase [Thioalkalispiraceae bacterium]|jgi:CDP-2,3-bis-(O-geranylgeranyl)-sn-glycerol synthase
MLELKLFILIVVANSAPVIARIIADRYFGKATSCPIDGGLKLTDNDYLFGHSKTVRGIIASLILTIIAGYLIKIAIPVSLSIALFAMLGDLVSSFIKRRLHKPPGSMVPGLDQIPESLLPLLAVEERLGLEPSTMLIIVFAFIVFDYLGTLLIRRLIPKKST